MEQKKKLIISLIFGLITICLLIYGSFHALRIDAYQVSFDGISLSIPKSWTIEEEGNTLVFSEGKDTKGRLSLLYETVAMQDLPELLGYGDEAIKVREVDEKGKQYYKITFATGNTSTVLFLYEDLLYGPPYQAVLSFDGVDGRISTYVADSFSVAKPGGKMPEKPLPMPDAKFLQDAVYVTKGEDFDYSYNLSTLDRLIVAGAEQPADEASVLHMITFSAGDAEKKVTSWYYLSAGAGEKWLYTYEETKEGEFIYKNDPQIVRTLTRKTSKEENYIRYYADDILLLETAFNPYLEEKNALLSYKNTRLNDKENIKALLQKVLPGDMEILSLQTGKQELRVTYKPKVMEAYLQNGALDETMFYQQSLLLFSLTEDLETVSVTVISEDETYSRSYKRKDAEKQFGVDTFSDFSEDLKTFENFLEDIVKMMPPKEGETGNYKDGTRPISIHKTVVLKKDFPDEDLESYLGKEMEVTLYETCDAGQKTYMAEACVDDTILGTYPVSNMKKFEDYFLR